jgi:hypothetical protein
MTTINDIVLVHHEDSPLFFARIEDINPDHKKDWYHVTLLVLKIPVQTITWTLRDIYIDGAEFTMGGKRMRLEKVAAPSKDPATVSPEKKGRKQEKKPVSSEKATVISFNPRKTE